MTIGFAPGGIQISLSCLAVVTMIAIVFWLTNSLLAKR